MNWSRSLFKYGVNSVPISKDRTVLLFTVLWYWITGHTPQALIFRYLNDYESLFKTLVQLTLEVVIVYFCKITGIEMLWICHNIKASSVKNHKRIVQYRKRLMLRSCEKVLFTHKCFVEVGCRNLRIDRNRADWTCFGKLDMASGRLDQNVIRALSFTRTVYDSRSACIGIWPGHLEEKNLTSFRLAINLSKCERRIAILVVGDLDYLDKSTKRRISSMTNVLLIDDFVNLHDRLLENVDFFVKGTNDLSIPLTLFHAMSAEKPLVVPSSSYLSKIVNSYNIGASTSASDPECKKVLNLVRNWDASNSKNFLETYSWEVGAKKISECVG